MSLIDMFKEFHHTAIQQEFPPSARCLFDTFLYKFNEAFWIDSLVLSERDLIRLTGLKKTTLHEAIHFLTSRYIIERKPFKNKFMFSLGDEMTRLLLKEQPTTNRPVTDQSATINRPLSDQSPTGLARSQIRAREDVKTSDVKTFPPPPPARACDTSELDLLIEYWDGELHGGRLIPEAQSQIEVWLAHHKFEWVKEVMREAALANGKRQGVDFKFLKKCVEFKENQKTRPTLKGGEKRGASGEMHYAEPEESGIDLTAY